MQHIGFRSATAMALILPALGLAALAANAQDRRGGGPAAAPHIAAPPAAAPHISAPPPAPHIAAPPPAPHISAPVAMPHIAAPATPHFATPAAHIAAPSTPHIAAPHIAAPNPHIATPHIAAPVHTASPHVPAANVGRPNAPAALTRQERNEERRIEQAHGNNPPNNPNAPTNGTKSLANRPGGPNGPNTPGANRETRTTPNGANPSLAGVPGERGRNTTNGLAARAQIYSTGHKPVLRNQAFAGLSTRDPATRALATSTFSGRFAHDHDRFEDRFDRHRFRGVVIGWAGPVFWPYAYSDFVDYTFWPYADDTFWPYAYDDVYYSMFGPYAPGLSTTYANLPASSGRARVAPPAAGGTAQVCSSQAAGLTDWPADLIARQVQPTDAQQAALNEFQDATAKAVQILQSACPTELPATPTGRLSVMRQRIEAMLQAVQVVRPALDRFYRSLSDEQKERFNALDQAGNAPARNVRRQGPDLAQICSADTARATALPIDRMDQLLHLSDPQRTALSELDAASKQAGQVLASNCPQDQTLTPTGRLAAMEQRLNAMLQAINTVQPALAKFYNSLNDEQRARFDRLSPRQV